MAQCGSILCIAIVGVLVAICHFPQSVFVPPPVQRAAPLAAATVAALSAPGAVLATTATDDIGVAADSLAKATYPLMKEIDWNSYLFLTKPGTASPTEWVKAVDKAIAMGAAMDPSTLQAGVKAHHAAIGRIDSKGVLPMDNYVDIVAAIGRMVASVPEATTMGVYNSFKSLVPAEVPKYLMSQVKEADAKEAYAAFLDFKDVVKSHPIKAEVFNTDQKFVVKLPSIDEAASKLSAKAYPFIKDVDWNSEIALKPLPKTEPKAVLKAIDKALVMGAAMDGKLLKEAAEAHNKAIASIDAKGVTSAADFQAINQALGRVIATVPTSKVMDVYNAFGKIVDPVVPSYLISTVNPDDAQAAYAALLEFKDAVKAVQPFPAGYGP